MPPSLSFLFQDKKNTLGLCRLCLKEHCKCKDRIVLTSQTQGTEKRIFAQQNLFDAEHAVTDLFSRRRGTKAREVKRRVVRGSGRRSGRGVTRSSRSRRKAAAQRGFTASRQRSNRVAIEKARLAGIRSRARRARALVVSKQKARARAAARRARPAVISRPQVFRPSISRPRPTPPAPTRTRREQVEESKRRARERARQRDVGERTITQGQFDVRETLGRLTGQERIGIPSGAGTVVAGQPISVVVTNAPSQSGAGGGTNMQDQTTRADTEKITAELRRLSLLQGRNLKRIGRNRANIERNFINLMVNNKNLVKLGQATTLRSKEIQDEKRFSAEKFKASAEKFEDIEQKLVDLGKASVDISKALEFAKLGGNGGGFKLPFGISTGVAVGLGAALVGLLIILRFK